MKSYKLTFAICWLFLFSFQSIFSQTKENYLAVYDSIIGKENLPITNGLFHFNNFRINNNKDIYFLSESFTKGSLNYMGQYYSNLDIKYDALNDQIVYRPSGKSEKTGINLIKSNVNTFQINGLNFVNLDKVDVEKVEFIKGFYEEKIKNNTLTFYIKHFKSKREVFINKNVFVEFSDEVSFVIFTNNKYTLISSKNNITKIFPDKKKVINEFYKENSDLKKKNKTLFFTNLLQNISQL